MIYAEILSPWIGSGVFGDEFRPLLLDVFPVSTFVDSLYSPVRPPTPANIAVASVSVTISPDVLALIEADSRFAVLLTEAQA